MMVDHIWGEKDFDWEGLNHAGTFIADYVRKYSGCRLIWKEKYGTLRYEWVLPPGYHFFPRNRLQIWWSQSWLAYVWMSFGYKVLLNGARIAIMKWPHLRAEILEDLEWRLEGE